MILVPAAIVGVVLGVWLSSPAAVVAPDAAVARAVAVDAAAPAIVAPAIDAAAPRVDAAVHVDAAIAIDAAIVLDAAPPIDAAPPPRPTIQEDFAAGHYTDALASCAAAGKVTGDAAIACTLSACKLHRDADARRTFASVPASKRDRVVSACPILEPPHPPPPPPPRRDAGVTDCKTDPMACQH